MRIRLSAVLAAVVLPAIAWPENLILNRLFSDQPALVVYELPGGEGRAELIHSLELLRDRFWPKAEIMDATGLDDAALRKRIHGPFVLYSVLDPRSRLLKLTAQPTAFQLDASAVLHWHELAVPAKDVRMVFAGKNPYAPGYAVVYAAGTPALLANANAVFHGPSSYHIYQGDKLLREGHYDQSLVEKPDRISLAEAIADVNQYFATVEYVHPNLFTRQSEVQYQATKKRTRDGVSAGLDSNGRIAVTNLAALLRAAAVSFQDAHTAVHWNATPNPGEVRRKRFPPFWLESENGRFFIAAAVNPVLEGKELIAVNDAVTADFLRPLLDLVSGETLTGKAAMALLEQHYGFLSSGLLGTEPGLLALKVRDLEGGVQVVQAPNLSPEEYQAFLKPRSASILRAREAVTRVEFLQSGRVARLIFPRCISSEEEGRKLEEIFTQIKQADVHDLILDVRGNPGGSTNITDYLFSYLHEGKFRGTARITSRFLYGVPEGVWKGEFKGPPPPPLDAPPSERAMAKPRAFYTGRVYLLIDNNVFSSAVYFSLLIRDYQVGKIVGYETGGVPQSFGNTHSFALKNSGIECNVSDRMLYAPKPRPDDDRHGVLPDIPLDRKLLAPYARESDPALAYMLKSIL